MNFRKLLWAIFAGALFLTSCSNENDGPTPYVPLGNYDSGTLILNQGGYNHGDASISYLSAGFTKFENDIFSHVNPDLTLGDTGQDIGFYGQFAYVVLNVSNKIEIVNRYTMAHVTTIETGLSNPRYIAFYNGKGYVTNWGDGSNPADDYVAVINLSTNTVTDAIPVAEGPERILENNGKLYVAQTGGFGFGNTISVINTSNNSVSSITVGDAPNNMQVKDGFLWVSYSGKPSWVTETAGGLVKIDLATNAVAHAYGYSDVSKHVMNLVIDGAFAYYTIDSGIYKFDLTANALPTTPAFTTTDQGVYGVYSFALKQNHFYVGDAGDYEHDGKVYLYSAGTGIGQSPMGTLESTYTVGVIPAGFYFNF